MFDSLMIVPLEVGRSRLWCRPWRHSPSLLYVLYYRMVCILHAPAYTGAIHLSEGRVIVLDRFFCMHHDDWCN